MGLLHLKFSFCLVICWEHHNDTILTIPVEVDLYLESIRTVDFIYQLIYVLSWLEIFSCCIPFTIIVWNLLKIHIASLLMHVLLYLALLFCFSIFFVS